MALQSALSQGVRAIAGRGVWVGTSFAFPALALFKDDSVALAMVLFILETLLGSAILAVRLRLARRASTEPEASARVGKALRLLGEFVLPFSVVPCFLLIAFTAIDAQRVDVWAWYATYASRAQGMALLLVAGAVLDTLIAPVRTVMWLETAAAWQASRTSVLVLAFMLGVPVMILKNTTQGFFWAYFGLRLFSDINGLRPDERERLRVHFLGADAARA
jgi:hypothetical protein